MPFFLAKLRQSDGILFIQKKESRYVMKGDGNYVPFEKDLINKKSLTEIQEGNRYFKRFRKYHFMSLVLYKPAIPSKLSFEDLKFGFLNH